MTPLIGLTTVRLTNPHGRVRDAMSREYADAIVQAGGIPVLIPLSAADDPAILRTLYDRLDGLVLPGGGDVHPAAYGEAVTHLDRSISELRDQVELQLVRWAHADDRPLLGICRGHQVLNVALGGTLIHDITASLNGRALAHDQDANVNRTLLVHDVEVNPGSRLARILGQTSVSVNSLHHQAVRDLAPALTATAFSSDGIIEGIEIPEARFFLGVQWHPEAITHLPDMRLLFERFVDACSA